MRYLEDKFQAQIPAESSIRSFVNSIFEQVGTMESFDDWLEVQLDEMSLSRARPAAAQAQATGGSLEAAAANARATQVQAAHAQGAAAKT